MQSSPAGHQPGSAGACRCAAAAGGGVPTRARAAAAEAAWECRRLTSPRWLCLNRRHICVLRFMLHRVPFVASLSYSNGRHRCLVAVRSHLLSRLRFGLRFRRRGWCRGGAGRGGAAGRWLGWAAAACSDEARDTGSRGGRGSQGRGRRHRRNASVAREHLLCCLRLR